VVREPRSEAPFVGRAATLAEVAAALAAGAGALVTGAPGVGKSRVVAEAARAPAGFRRVLSVTATPAGRSIPFGAFAAAISPGTLAGRDGLGALASALAEVAPAGPGRVLLCVDDVHHLDPRSTALVDRAVRSGRATVLLTARTGEVVPDEVLALWKDQLLHRMELGPLERTAHDRLLVGLVGGPVDGASRDAMWRITDGNPLFARELVADAVAHGTLAAHRGVWRWSGAIGERWGLVDLVESRIAAAGRAVRPVLEVVAWGEPVPLAIVERLVESDPLEWAEGGGLLRVADDGGRLACRLAHPLFGEVVRATTPLTRARRLARRLAAEFAVLGTDRWDDLLRAAVLQLQAGVADRPELFLPAARQAMARFAFALAERLAQAAVDAGGGAAANQVLAEALTNQGRHSEAVVVIDAAHGVAGGLAERAIQRATNLYWGLARTEDAEAELGDAAGSVEGAARLELVATQAWIALFDGRCREALDVAGAVLTAPDVGARGFVWATTAAVPAAALVGRTADAVAVADAGLALAHRARDDHPFGEEQVGWVRCLALALAGRLREARAAADEGYRAATQRSPVFAAGWAGFRGLVARMEGHMGAARSSLQEAVAFLDAEDPYRFLAMCLGQLAAVHAVTGAPAEAEALLAQADAAAAGSPGNRLFEPWLDVDRAWVDAAAGRRREALAAMGRVVAASEARGEATMAAVAAYDLARLGDAPAAAAVLDRLAPAVDSPLVAALADAAGALATGDADALESVAERVGRCGADLHAAELLAVAAGRHRRRGLPLRAASARERAIEHLSRCGPVTTPLLSTGDLEEALTDREREVATMAARGLTSTAIAGRLVVSRRTVDNHLGRVYAKLGLRGRGELPGLFPAD
jgi:DNA-binding CsgD family transcriptional regulator